MVIGYKSITTSPKKRIMTTIKTNSAVKNLAPSLNLFHGNGKVQSCFIFDAKWSVNRRQSYKINLVWNQFFDGTLIQFIQYCSDLN